MANGIVIAKGEVVIIDENFGVRITEITGNHDASGLPDWPEQPIPSFPTMADPTTDGESK